MTPGTEPALTPDEWLSGVNRGKAAGGDGREPRERPGSGTGPQPRLTPSPALPRSDPILMSLKEGYKKTSKIVFKAPVREKKSVVVNGIDLLENVPPRTENEVGQRSPGDGGGTVTGRGGEHFLGAAWKATALQVSAGTLRLKCLGTAVPWELKHPALYLTTENPKGAALSS